MTTILLRQDELTKNTPLGGNIDVDKYVVAIADFQRIRVEEVLGETLYNKICEDFENDDLTGDYLKLYEDYLKPYIIHGSAMEYLLYGAYQINNGGISKHNPADSTSIDKVEVDYLVQNQRLKMEMYESRLERWLCKFHLPEYVSNSNNIVNPLKSKMICGKWYLDNPY